MRSPHDLLRLDPLAVLRVALVVCQAGAIQSLWPMWQVRPLSPPVPLFDGLPAWPMGVVLLASLVPIPFRPRWAIPLHVGLLVFAITLDQLRLHVACISLALMLLASGRWRLSRTLAWSALASLWLWAGLTKAFSAGFLNATVLPLVDRWDIPWAERLLLVGIPAAEIALGLAAAWRRTRRAAGWGGLALHVGIIVGLGLPWHTSLFFWNVGLAAASVLLLAVGPAERPPPSSRQAGYRTALVVFLFVYPMGSYVALVDPYVSHHLYTGDGIRAQVCDGPASTCSSLLPNLTGASIGASFPGSHRLYHRWFQLVCLPGQTLRVSGLDVRPPLDRLAGAADTTEACRRDVS